MVSRINLVYKHEVRLQIMHVANELTCFCMQVQELTLDAVIAGSKEHTARH